jgi:hypothetical protein
MAVNIKTVPERENAFIDLVVNIKAFAINHEGCRSAEMLKAHIERNLGKYSRDSLSPREVRLLDVIRVGRLHLKSIPDLPTHVRDELYAAAIDALLPYDLGEEQKLFYLLPTVAEMSSEADLSEMTS